MNTDSVTAPPEITYPTIRVSAKELELWRGERCLFDDLSFTLSRPALYVRGANGSGKTTLLKILCGLTATERGDVQWTSDGDVLGTSEILGKIAYSGHQDALNPALTVAENLQWGAGLYRAITRDEIVQVTEEHELDFLLPLLASSLSAGQKRRVSLLRSVLSGVPVWIWDEPFANLDVAGVAWVNARLKNHVRRGGCLVLSAHQPPELMASEVQILELNA